MIDMFKTIKGLKPVDPAAFEPFIKVMQEETIPQIVETMRQRAKNGLRHEV